MEAFRHEEKKESCLLGASVECLIRTGYRAKGDRPSYLTAKKSLKNPLPYLPKKEKTT